MSNGERIGEVTHYFNRINVAVVMLDKDVQMGDQVHFLGRHTDFRQEITSMQVEHESISHAEAGSEIAIKVIKRVRRGDSIYRLMEED